MKKISCFTLVEILAVLAITGILTVGTAVGVNRMWQNNRIDICESEMRDFTMAFKSYYTDYKNWRYCRIQITIPSLRKLSSF